MRTDDKYVVIPRDRVNWRNRDGDKDYAKFANISEDDVLEDAVVIRERDVFAAPALWAYANTIGVVADTLRRTSDDETTLRTAKQLQSVADYFSERAEQAAGRNGRLPD